MLVDRAKSQGYLNAADPEKRWVFVALFGPLDEAWREGMHRAIPEGGPLRLHMYSASAEQAEQAKAGGAPVKRRFGTARSHRPLPRRALNWMLSERILSAAGISASEWLEIQ